MTPTVTETSGIQIRQLHKSYGSLDVLSGLDLTLPAGHIYGLVGPDGHFWKRESLAQRPGCLAPAVA